MRPTALRLVAASSLLLGLCCAAETRPRYGGTVRVQAREVAELRALVFETLVRLDDGGEPQPWLATTWESREDGRRWQFWLRRKVKFHDGTPLTPSLAAAGLQAANPGWRVRAVGDSVVIESDAALPAVAAELALPRNAITRADQANGMLGTGPFRVTHWKDNQAVVAANDDYWDGRPFVDAVEVTAGRGLRELMVDFDLGKAEVVELSPEHARRAQQERARVAVSLPNELLALVFARDSAAAAETRLRQALALTVDRGAIHSVLLQRQGEPATSLLPNWMSGYAFLFQAAHSVTRARELRARTAQAAPLVMAYDAADPLERLVAERIALNAREAGIQVQPSASRKADFRLVRVPLGSLNPAVAIGNIAASLEFSRPALASSSPQELYTAEKKLLEGDWVCPIVHLPRAYAVAPPVRNWTATRDGSLRLADVWLETEKR